MGETEIAPYALRPTAESATIRWCGEARGSCLEFWPEGQAVHVQRVPGERRGDGLRRVALHGLRPGTRYSYRREGEGEIRSFCTAPVGREASFTLAIFGDPQNHVHYAETVATMAAVKPDLAIGLGDFVGNSDAASYGRYLRLSDPLLRHTALLPVPGNHDYRLHSNPFPRENDSRVFDQHLGNSQGNQTAIVWGPLLLLGLDYPDRGAWDADGPEAGWLRAQLHMAREQELGVVVCQHCPCFTSTRIDWAVDDRVLPGVLGEFADVVLADFGAHIHTYERSLFRGIPFVTTGGAGELYDFPVDERPNPHQISAANRLHICLLQVESGKASVRAVDLAGQTIDEFPLG
jgi:hypothetical protein